MFLTVQAEMPRVDARLFSEWVGLSQHSDAKTLNILKRTNGFCCLRSFFSINDSVVFTLCIHLKNVLLLYVIGPSEPPSAHYLQCTTQNKNMRFPINTLYKCRFIYYIYTT